MEYNERITIKQTLESIRDLGSLALDTLADLVIPDFEIKFDEEDK